MKDGKKKEGNKSSAEDEPNRSSPFSFSHRMNFQISIYAGVVFSLNALNVASGFSLGFTAQAAAGWESGQISGGRKGRVTYGQ